MFPDILPSGDITVTTNDAMTHFLEYDYSGDLGIQEEKPKPKTWQEKTDEERDDNLRGLFGYN